MDVYSDISYHLLASFLWIIYHGVEGSKFNVVGVIDWIPRRVQRGLDEENLSFLKQSWWGGTNFLVP